MGAVDADDEEEAMGAAVIDVRLEMVSALPFDFGCSGTVDDSVHTKPCHYLIHSHAQTIRLPHRCMRPGIIYAA